MLCKWSLEHKYVTLQRRCSVTTSLQQSADEINWWLIELKQINTLLSWKSASKLTHSKWKQEQGREKDRWSHFYLCRQQNHQDCVVYVLINHNVHLYARGSQSTARAALGLGAIGYKHSNTSACNGTQLLQVTNTEVPNMFSRQRPT